MKISKLVQIALFCDWLISTKNAGKIKQASSYSSASYDSVYLVMEALGLPSLPTPTLAFSSSHHLKARKLCSTASPWLRSCCPFPPKVKALHRTHHLPVRKLYTMCFAVLLFFFFSFDVEIFAIWGLYFCFHFFFLMGISLFFDSSALL